MLLAARFAAGHVQHKKLAMPKASRLDDRGMRDNAIHARGRRAKHQTHRLSV